jgi:RNA polymerase sigma factor (sigma-70 family)
MSTETPSIGRIDVDPASAAAEIAAAMAGDVAARWRALEACRDYLQLVVRRGHWSNQAGRSATSDLVQDTIVGAWRNFSRFQGRTPAQLRAWMRAILVHASLNARRRRHEARIESGGSAGDVLGPTTSPSQAADKNASRAALDAALAGLPQRSRMAIHLRLWDQRSFAEIGAELGISEDAARMLYGRALAKLRESMRPGHDPG